MKSRQTLPTLFACLLMLIAAGAIGCSKQQAPAEASADVKPATASDAAPAPDASASSATSATAIATPSAPKPDINGNHVMQYVKEVVAFGSRPPGSPGHAKLEQYIVSKLNGVDVEQDRFTAQTPVGPFPINNIIAKFPGKKDGIIVVAGHYDTLYAQPKFVGANDGGSSTALLLALADQFRGKQLEGYSVWLVWTDGEEAFVKWTDTDSVYGTRQLAQKWQQDGTAKKIKAFILVDMIGDADLDLLKDMNSTPWLNDTGVPGSQQPGLSIAFLSADHGDGGRPHSICQDRRAGGGPDRFHVWLSQCVLAHAGRHGGQAEPAVAGDHRRRGAGVDSAGKREVEGRAFSIC